LTHIILGGEIIRFVQMKGEWLKTRGDTWWSSLPLNRKCPNVSKTVEIPTPKPHIIIFLFFLTRRI
jgi:hypothetical protein